MTWNFSEAKSRLNEVVDLALTEGPQTITRGHDAVVLLSARKYAELTGGKLDFKKYLLRGIGLDALDLTRDESPMRDVD